MRSGQLSKLAGAVAVVTALSACQRNGDAGGLTAPLEDREWSLVALDGQPAGPGAGGQAATLLLSATDHRAGGFGGCNRYSADYSIAGDSLTLGPIAMTMMACPSGMELEQQFGTALSATRRFRVDGNTLQLVGPAGVLARLEAT